ncbi:MAG: hypothetical protein GX351_00945, partial [Peptococcaceae bacterium]|nr:hypothetical protein [Peptococcaceae bacterium]
QQQQQTEDIPKSLERIEKDLEQVFLALAGPSVELEQKGQGQANNGQQSQQQSSSSDGKQNQQQNSDSKQAAGQTEDSKTQISETLRALHLGWNDYMPEIVAKGASRELLDGFSTALNELSTAISTTDRSTILIAANKLYKYVPDFYALYEAKLAELKRINYYTRNIIIYAASDDWTNTALNLSELKDAWTLAKNSSAKQQEDTTRLDLSIYELEKVIQSKDKDLVKTKGELTLNNIQTLLKSLEK